MTVATDLEKVRAGDRAKHGQVLEPTTRIRAGQRVPSIGERATTPLFEGRQRFVAYVAYVAYVACVAHELRTPLATQRALLELALADLNADVAACERSARMSSTSECNQSACSRRVSPCPGPGQPAAVRAGRPRRDHGRSATSSRPE